MKIFQFCLIVLLIIASIKCNSSRQNFSNNSVRAIRFKDNMLSLIQPGLDKLRKGSVFYFYKDYKILEIEVTNTTYSSRQEEDSVIIGDTLLAVTITKRYFIMKKGLNVAMDIDSAQKKKPRLVNGDSIMKLYGRVAVKHKPGRCLELKYQKKKKGVLMLSYEVCDRENIYNADSVYYFLSNKMKDLDFSIDDNVDSMHTMKLFKSQRIYNTLYKTQPKDSIGIPRVLSQEMNEIKVENPGFIISLCDVFDKAISK